MTAKTPPPNFGDDRPYKLLPAETAPELRSPLGVFNGEKPPAPAWFERALAKAPERSFVSSDGTQLELLTWGQVGKPGLLFIHGGGAHADWWSFIAPFFAATHRVAAFSLPGMGLSGWRDTYTFKGFAADAEAAARAAGLYEGGETPLYIGHSFGGAITYYTAAMAPAQMRAAIIVDSGFGGPPTTAEKAALQGVVTPAPDSERVGGVYRSFNTALARFRLMPPQPVANLYIADHIGRLSVRQTPLPDGSGDGFAWRYDPTFWDKLDRSAMTQMLAGADRTKVPAVHIIGEHSLIIARGAVSPLLDLPKIIVPDAHHHVMIDQPLALVAALRSVLTVWPS